MAAAALTFLVWALLTASVLWWWLRAGSSAAPEAPVAGRASADLASAAVARALGAKGAAEAPQAAPKKRTDTNPRFALRGVLTHGSGGAALIAVGGQVRTVRVGEPVGDDAEGWTLREALPHAVVLAGNEDRTVRLDMPGDEERKRLIKARAAQAPQAAPGARLAPAAPAPAQRPASRARWRRVGEDGQLLIEPQNESQASQKQTGITASPV